MARPRVDGGELHRAWRDQSIRRPRLPRLPRLRPARIRLHNFHKMRPRTFSSSSYSYYFLSLLVLFPIPTRIVPTFWEEVVAWSLAVWPSACDSVPSMDFSYFAPIVCGSALPEFTTTTIPHGRHRLCRRHRLPPPGQHCSRRCSHTLLTSTMLSPRWCLAWTQLRTRQPRRPPRWSPKLLSPTSWPP
jgi:hypothetical protein